MAKIRLNDIAFARSGDKGDSVNIGVAARNPEQFPLLQKFLTAELVKEHFKGLCNGEVTRYELPNLAALNFVLTKSLDGGGTVSLRSDAQGKTFAAVLLYLELEI